MRLETLMKAQNDKANKLEALIEIGDLSEDNFADLGLKGVALHRFNQDRRQAFHDIALAKAYGPNEVRPGGPKRFEQETRYAASTTTIEPMRPIELYKTQVDRDQRRFVTEYSVVFKNKLDLTSRHGQRRTMHLLKIIITAMSHEIVYRSVKTLVIKDKPTLMII
jgi:hypothetical protein